MSLHQLDAEGYDYSDGRTKQAFKDSTDINKLLAKVAQGESITHLAKHGAMYGDFTDIDDLLTGMNRLKKAEQIFADLPGELRQEFDQSSRKFFNFVNDERNKDSLRDLLPQLTQQGRQLQDMQRRRDNIDLDPVVVATPSPAPVVIDPDPVIPPSE